MSKKLFRIKAIQPTFDKLYSEYKDFYLVETSKSSGVPIFPQSLLPKLPKDIRKICEELNENLINKRNWASILLLRKLLPLAIVRKFQSLNQENEILMEGDWLDTKALLGKIEQHLKEKRVYKEILNYKILTDSSQHSYAFSPDSSDAEGIAIKLRVFLEQLFLTNL